MSDYDELDDQLFSALQRAGVPADPAKALDRVVATKNRRAHLRSMRARGAALLSVIVLAATLVVATSGGSHPRVSHVASGGTSTTIRGTDGVVDPQTAGPDGSGASPDTTTPATGASASPSAHPRSTTAAPTAPLGAAVFHAAPPDAVTPPPSKTVQCDPRTRTATAPGGASRIVFVDANHGWGLPGPFVETEMISTPDGGHSWYLTKCNGEIRDISFVDATHGWAAGTGFVMATSDGGMTWQQQTLPAFPASREAGTLGPWSFDAVSFLDVDHGWAVGNGGAAAATTDGGRHWVAQEPPTTAVLESVSFGDPSHGWIAGGFGNGSRYSTTDGGATWAAHPQDASIAHVAFVDPATGWWAGDQTVQVTHDGGQTWQAQPAGIPPQHYLNALHFIDAQHGWVLATTVKENESPDLLSTSDGGTTWNRLALPSPQIIDMSFIDAQHGWAATLDGVFSTIDGGQTWTPQLPAG